MTSKSSVRDSILNLEKFRFLKSNSVNSSSDSVSNSQDTEPYVISETSLSESNASQKNDVSPKKMSTLSSSENENDDDYDSDNKPTKSVKVRQKKLHNISESDDGNPLESSADWLSKSKPKEEDVKKTKRKRLPSDSDYNPDDEDENIPDEELFEDDAPVVLYPTTKDVSSRIQALRYAMSKFPDVNILKVKKALTLCNWNAKEAVKNLGNGDDADEHDTSKVVKIKEKQLKKRRRIDSDSDSETDEDNVARCSANGYDDDGGSDDFDDDEVDDRNIVYDSDEEYDVRSDSKMTADQKQVIAFLQNATAEELQTIPCCGMRKVNGIIAARPFTSWSETVKKVRRSKYIDTDILERVYSVIEMRATVCKLLEHCQKLSDLIESDAAHLLRDVTGESLRGSEFCFSQPKYINPDLTLRPHQLLGVNWLCVLHKHKVNGILADEMGLGKTVQTIGLLAYLMENGERGPHVVIVPSSTFENWIRELQLWCPRLRIKQYIGDQYERLRMRHEIVKKKKCDFDVMVTTYNLVTRNRKDFLLFKKFPFNYAVFDEAHMMKNMATQSYKYLMQVNAKRRLLLTGTPLQNNLMELISIVMFAMPKIFKKSRDDLEKIFTSAIKGSGENKFHKQRIEQAKKILKPFILRRLKHEVLQDLPDKQTDVIYCKMTESQCNHYKNLVRRFSNKTNDHVKMGLAVMMELRKMANHPLLLRIHYDDDKIREIASRLSQDEFYKETNKDYIIEDLSILSDHDIHRICENYVTCRIFKLSEDHFLSSGKFNKLDELLPDWKQQNSKILLFSQFTMVLDIVEVYMKLRKHKYLRMDGSTPVLQRQNLMDEFNNNTDIFVFLLSTRSGGLGINLTSANTVILHDIDYNPFNDRQAEDRCHRVGQTREVNVYRLISENSIEVNMLKGAKEKLKLEKQITEGVDSGNENLEVGSMLKTVLDV